MIRGRPALRSMARAAALPVAALATSAALVVAATVTAPVGTFPAPRAATAEADHRATSGRPALAAAAMPAFYTPPSPLPPGPPGTIVRDEDATVPGLRGTARLVMYKSESVRGGEIGVTGFVMVPPTPPPPGGYPIVARAHGTTGLADECAPTLDGPLTFFAANDLLDRGYVVVATDYAGLGPPGRHPYVVGESEARSVIDAVRAARALLGDDVVGTDFAVWGLSQGGHATTFVHRLAGSLAPELRLKGAVAGAPPAQFDLMYRFLVTSPYRYYLLMVAAGVNAAYGDAAAPLDEVLDAAGITAVDLVDRGCIDFLAGATAGLDVESLMVQQPDGSHNPVSNPVWGPLIRAQDPLHFDEAAPGPLLIVHGGADEEIPAASSGMLAGRLCELGQDLERWVYPGRGHTAVLEPSKGDTLEWLANRFAGVATPDPLYPAGQADVQATVCVAGKMVTRTAPSGPEAPPAAAPATPAAASPSFTG